MALVLFERRAGSPRWPVGTALGVAALVFGAWWLLLSVGHSLGTCGEDSDITAEQYRRLCGAPEDNGAGLLSQRLTAIGLAATVVTLGTAVLVWRRRARWPFVGAALVALCGLGVLGVHVDA